jgi:hypothetical protein
MDPVVVENENWENMNSLWENIVDFVKLRNVDIGKNRHDIITTSLRYIMSKSEKNYNDYKELIERNK